MIRSLERQLPVAAFVLLGSLAAVVTVAAYRQVRESSLELASARLARSADQLSRSVSSGLLGTRETLASLAEHESIVAALSEPETADLAAATAALADPFPTGDRGIHVAAWDLAQEVAVLAVSQDTAGWVGPPSMVDTATILPLAASNDTTIHYSVVAPVRDDRRLVGFLQVRQKLQRSETSGLVQSLIGQEGTLLLGTADGVWSESGMRVPAPPAGLVPNGMVTTYGRAGATRLGVAEPVGRTGIILVTEIPRSAALAPARRFLATIVPIAGLMLLLTTVAAWLLGQRITRPLGELRQVARGLGAGDLHLRASVRGHPEIAEVARAFNKMASDTQDQMITVRGSEQRFRSLVTATAQIVWWMDAEGNVQEPIPSWQAFTGLSFDDIRGAGWTSALHPDDAAHALQIWKQAVEHRSLYETEYRIRRHDGEYRWMVARGVPLLDQNGKITEWVGTCTDITDRREMEGSLKRKESELQQAQRLDAIGRLAGGIAHDFNNLLTAIIGPAELAVEELPEGHPVREDLHDIRSTAVRASELTRQLLTFGRQQVTTPVVLDVNECIEGTARLLERVLSESVELDLALNARRPTIKADRTQLEQVIVNLAVNARDAMPQGGRLTIETEDVDFRHGQPDEYRDLRPGRYVLLSVTDTGYGMDAETRERMFEPFFTTKDTKGTGLGLSTVYGIVRQSGGHIWVYSEPGEGTSFKIHFPLEIGEGVADEPEEEAPPLPEGRETVLLAEDEPKIRQLTCRFLEGLGYHVLAAEDGADALRVAATHQGRIDLLLSDIVMPELNGVELWERLRVSRPDLPALFLSGWASGAVARHDILDSHVPFLEKPFSVRQLGARVREVLDEAHAAQRRATDVG